LQVGRVAGHRGRGGEITIKVLGGDAGLWTELSRVWIGSDDDDAGRFYPVENSRAYRDRLVLKLEGVNGATAAAQLRGLEARASADEAPRLPDGVYYVDRLIGMGVRDGRGRELGRVRDVLRTGGTDLLVVVPGSTRGEQKEEDEIMIPMAKGIVVEVDEEEGRITVDPPEGLLDLNRSG
jgi:16S rRNA processing protein RimM